MRNEKLTAADIVFLFPEKAVKPVIQIAKRFPPFLIPNS